MSVVFSSGATAETMATWEDSEYFSSGFAPFFLIMMGVLQIIAMRCPTTG